MLGFYLSGPSHDCICPLQWRHYGRDLVSNHRHLDCLLNRLLRRRWQKTLKLRVTALCGGNLPVIAELSSQRTSNAENVSIWWHHHAIGIGIFPGHILICFDCMSRMRAHPPSMCNQSGHAIVPRQNYATWFGHGQKGCSGIKWWNASFFKSVFSRIFLYTVALNTWDYLEESTQRSFSYHRANCTHLLWDVVLT